MQKDKHYSENIKIEILEAKWGVISLRVYWDDIAYKDCKVSIGDTLNIKPEMRISYTI